VLNYSRTARDDDWEYLVYLSDDSVITTADTFLGSGTFHYVFSSRDAVRVTTTAPLIPADTPSGFYFIGVILNYPDANPANNASNGREASSVVIFCPPSAPPVYVGPYQGGTCLQVNVTFNWNAVAGLADYQLQVGTSCGDGAILEMRRTQYTWYGLDNNTTYFWRVRSRSQCDEWGTWGPCWSFTTRPDLTEVMTPAGPDDGEICVDTENNVTWTAYPNGLMYEFRIDTRCGEGTVHQTVQNSGPENGPIERQQHDQTQIYGCV
jgi:hypothetical protein